MTEVLIEGRPATREEWHEKRRRGIGASEIAAVLGVSPYADDTPLNLFLRKLGRLPDKEENEAMWWGTEMEPLIARRYRMHTGCEFAHEQLFLRHPEYDWMLATIDRTTTEGRVVELKTIGHRGAGILGIDGTDEVPAGWICQVQQQLMVAEACLPGFARGDEADVAAVVGGQETRFFTVRRDDRLCRQIVRRGAEFWDRVERDDPPDPVPGKDGRLMAVLYPEPAGEVEATPTIQALADAWEDLGVEVRDKDAERERLRDEILRCMRDAEVAVLMDGRRLKRTVVEGKPERTVVVKATRPYAQLRITKARKG